MSFKAAPPYHNPPEGQPNSGPGVPAWARAGLLLIGLTVLVGGFWLLTRSPVEQSGVSSQINFSDINPDFKTPSSGSTPSRVIEQPGITARAIIPPLVPTSPRTAATVIECLPPVPTNANEVQSCVSNSVPEQNSIVTVFGRLLINGQSVTGLTMETSWDHKYLNGSCNATTDGRGVARCSRNISNSTNGYAVVVTVKFKYNGKTYSGETNFTPAK